jgi:nitrogen fixation/metabolism regulation signal transduction histidine kinase
MSASGPSGNVSLTRRLEVEHMGFLLERLAADTPSDQQLRELNQNSIEAILRRQRAGDAVSGKIVWDIDWAFYQSNGSYKLSITDNGDGMSGEDMVRYLNNLSVQEC